MKDDRFTKKQRQKLRELASLVYERELATALRELEHAFTRWHQQEINTFVLDNEIHKYHNGVARDLYKKHNYSKPDWIVQAAIRDGILSNEVVGEDLFNIFWEILQSLNNLEDSDPVEE